MPNQQTTVLLAHKLFGPARGLSHIGLGVAAVNTQKVLRSVGIQANLAAISSPNELNTQLAKQAQDHVIISAPWIPTLDLADLARKHSETHFSVCCHSNIGFLQADPSATKLIRELMDLEQSSHNVHLSGNCRRFCDWVQAAFSKPCAYLPNLYYLDEHGRRPVHSQPVSHVAGPLRVGIFGATRPLKNLLTGAAAAVDIARSLRLPLELWLSGGRLEGGATVLSSVQEMLGNLPHVAIKYNSWQAWPDFRRSIGHMHLLLQPSYTESFNMVTADGIAEGIPSVVSSAIDWLPRHFHAEVDDALDIARVGRRLLLDPHAAFEGLQALKRYVADGISEYRNFFEACRT